jgi:tetratricopeptide (TPR) repeat protein
MIWKKTGSPGQVSKFPMAQPSSLKTKSNDRSQQAAKGFAGFLRSLWTAFARFCARVEPMNAVGTRCARPWTRATQPCQVAGSWRGDCLLGFILVAATLAAYLPALNGKFVWDDDSWTSTLFPRLQAVSGLWSMWCNPHALRQYYPLTGTTFWLDYHLWGFNTLPYHIENVLLHSLAALLFWRLLRRLQVPGPWLAGFVFALHPLMVESAGWITERKNVLSLVLFLGALLAYGRHALFGHAGDMPVAAAGNSPWPRWGAYASAFTLFLAALLAKTTACALPAVILLLCWWQRGHVRWRPDLLPTLPFFVAAAGLGLLISWWERHQVGAAGPGWNFTLLERCLIAGRAFWFYAVKVLWPAQLCFVYPRWQPDTGSVRQWTYPLGALAALLALWLARGRVGRGPATAAFFFAGTLFPLLGFMNSYFMRYSFVCDHWAYLPSLGLIALIAGLVARAAERLRAPAVFHGFAVVILPVLAVLTWRQSGMYADAETLWRTTLARNPAAGLAHNGLGAILLERGELDEALAEFQKSLEVQTNNPEALNNMGAIYLRKGRLSETIYYLQKALELNPDYAASYDNLGFVTLQMGRVDEAIAYLRKALEICPDYANAHNNMGSALVQKGRFAEAVAHYETAQKLQPDKPHLLNNLAWVLVTCPEASIRNGAKALELAQQADRLAGGQDPRVLATMAAAYAEVGRFSEAVAAAQRALSLSIDQNNAALADMLRGHLKLYQSGSPLCGHVQ